MFKFTIYYVILKYLIKSTKLKKYNMHQFVKIKKYFYMIKLITIIISVHFIKSGVDNTRVIMA